jgi:hypothetical protein
MYTAEYVTTVVDGKCVSSIINTKDKEVAIELAPAKLGNSVEVKLMDDMWLVRTEYRLREVAKQVRFEHVTRKGRRL